MTAFGAGPRALPPSPGDHMAYMPAACDDRRRRGATPDDLDDTAERVWLSIAERFGLNTEGVRIRLENRMTEDADWD